VTLARQPEPLRSAFAPTLGGLAVVVGSDRILDPLTAPGTQRFLGWTTGRHWLLVGLFPAGAGQE
jgi:hypothetical protein